LKFVSLSGVVPIALAFALTIPALAQDAAGRRIAAAEFDMLEAAQSAANAAVGPRTVPGRSIRCRGR
jgi:monoterpene epsilon-lactone hydrolase